MYRKSRVNASALVHVREWGAWQNERRRAERGSGAQARPLALIGLHD